MNLAISNEKLEIIEIVHFDNNYENRWFILNVLSRYGYTLNIGEFIVLEKEDVEFFSNIFPNEIPFFVRKNDEGYYKQSKYIIDTFDGLLEKFLVLFLYETCEKIGR
jgi:hypothetical protein